MLRSDRPSWRCSAERAIEKPHALVTDLSRKYMREKTSLGISCCRYNNGRPEILVVKKRFTYAFNMFVNGKYNSNSNGELMDLFNCMTSEEKHDILSLNFQQIWYRLWLNNPPSNANFFIAKSKYENAFISDGSSRLRRLISGSRSVDVVWEIPKGKKKSKSEPDIHCAVREFGEETGLAKKSYRIFPQACKTYSYIDAGIKYVNTYYFAFTKNNSMPNLSFKRMDQIEEISDIRWMDTNAIKHVDNSGRLSTFIKPVFKFMKKHARN